MWGWHSRGCVWDKVAAEWACKEEWTSKKERSQIIENKRDVVTFVVKNVKHSTIHMTRSGQRMTHRVLFTHPQQRIGELLSTSSTICTALIQIPTSHSRGKEKIPKTIVSHLEQIRQKWAYETSIRFSSRCLYEKLSTPRVRRTN